VVDCSICIRNGHHGCSDDAADVFLVVLRCAAMHAIQNIGVQMSPEQKYGVHVYIQGLSTYKTKKMLHLGSTHGWNNYSLLAHDQSPATVYVIISVQLIITTLSCALFGLHSTLSNLTTLSRSGNLSPVLAAMPLVSILVSTISWFIMCMNLKACHTAPAKWWLLGLLTLGQSVLVGFLLSFYHF
jgi:hypothetical protein